MPSHVTPTAARKARQKERLNIPRHAHFQKPVRDKASSRGHEETYERSDNCHRAHPLLMPRCHFQYCPNYIRVDVAVRQEAPYNGLRCLHSSRSNPIDFSARVIDLAVPVLLDPGRHARISRIEPVVCLAGIYHRSCLCALGVVVNGNDMHRTL